MKKIIVSFLLMNLFAVSCCTRRQQEHSFTSVTARNLDSVYKDILVRRCGECAGSMKYDIDVGVIDLSLTVSLQSPSLQNLDCLKDYPLRNLDLFSATNLCDITGLRGMKGLRFLYISDSLVTNLSPLENGIFFSLSLIDTPIVDLHPLKSCSIRSLDLSGTKISDNELSVLTDVSDLRELALNSTKISDLKTITQLKLVSLSIDNTKVETILPLTNMPLRVLSLINLKIPENEIDILLEKADIDKRPLGIILPNENVKESKLWKAGVGVASEAEEALGVSGAAYQKKIKRGG